MLSGSTILERYYSSLFLKLFYQVLFFFFKGIGFSVILVTTCLSNFYSVIIAWVVRFLFSSFRKELVWHKCSNSWNTDECIERGKFHFALIIFSLKNFNVQDTIIGNLTYSIKNNISILYCSRDIVIPGCTQGVPPTAQFLE